MSRGSRIVYRKSKMENGMILYEDQNLIVCHKPAGIPVQSARIGTKDMVSILNNYLAEKRGEDASGGKSGKVPETVYVVHRLDQPVEGVIVFAKTKSAASELGKQISQNRMKKIYRAVCCVTEKAEEKFYQIERGSTYELVDYLVKNGKTNTSSVANKGDRDAKCAKLSFTVIDNIRKETRENGAGCALSGEDDSRNYVLAEIYLETGRHHQIRVQMAEAGLPLYGDQKYHSKWSEYLCNDYIQGNRVGLALCAVSLDFYHPVSGKKMTFHTEPKAEVFKLFSERYNIV